ncbi:hypothetical protein KKA24_00330 [Patescibacteria group bacterium]|nr:hypothetical protein [Patescibacteria group bacterium]
MTIIENIKSVDKKILVAVIVITILIVASIYYLMQKEEIKTEEPVSEEVEDVLNSLTAPNNSADFISSEVQESLSAPDSENVQASEDVLNSLTAPIQ